LVARTVVGVQTLLSARRHAHPPTLSRSPCTVGVSAHLATMRAGTRGPAAASAAAASAAAAFFVEGWFVSVAMPRTAPQAKQRKRGAAHMASLSSALVVLFLIYSMELAGRVGVLLGDRGGAGGAALLLLQTEER